MENYEIPEMEVIRFEAEDIITTSSQNLLAICWDESESQEQ